MTIEQATSILGQFATWFTLIIVFLTLREMEKQRKASQKPELIITNISLHGYYKDDDDMHIISQWSNIQINDNKTDIIKGPKIFIYNIGAGAAKEIKIKWDFDIQGTIKHIQDYSYHNSIPIIVSTHNNFLHIETKDRKVVINVKLESNPEYAYLMPASITSQGLEVHLPWTFMELLSILVFIGKHQLDKKSNDGSVVQLEDSFFEFPTLHCGLSYLDIGGEKYSKKFDVTVTMFAIRTFEKEFNSTKPAFNGMVEFKER